MLKFETGNLLDYPFFCHQVNCKGVMGAGLAKQVRDRYPIVYDKYLSKVHLGNNLGQVQTVKIDDRVCVNMFAQNGYGQGKRHTSYDAFKKCLVSLTDILNSAGAGRYKTVAFPYGIGCGLGGGDWYIILGMLKDFSKTIKQDVVIVSYAAQ